MHIQSPGRINDRLLFLGDSKICMYLLMGENYLLIGGGMSFSPPVVEKQLDEHGIKRERLNGLLILHSHFDHCTAAPYFRKAYPGLRIYASGEARRIFEKPKAVGLIAQFEGRARENRGVPPEFNGIPLSFNGLQVDQTVSDGDVISLGVDLSVRIFETPGHSKCSLTAYSPELKVLFPSDGAPLPLREGEPPVIMANDDFPAYIRSLERLQDLETEYCAFEHGGVLAGEEARSFVKDGLEQARYLRTNLQTRLAHGDSEADIAGEITADAGREGSLDFIPDDVLHHVIQNMVKTAK